MMFNPTENFSENEKLVFGCMREERGNTYSTIECEHGTPKKELKKIIKRLKDLHLIEVVSFVDPDGDTGYFGRGWVLTDHGDVVQGNLDNKYLG